MNDLDERKFYEYLALIDKKIRTLHGSGWNGLSVAERIVVVAYFFALEVSNGGIEQFFVNPSGDRWQETLKAIKAIGASRLASLFEQALGVFPEGTPSEDQATRCEQLAAAGEPAASLLSQLTQEYYQLQANSPEDCLYHRLTAYAITQLGEQEG